MPTQTCVSSAGAGPGRVRERGAGLVARLERPDQEHGRGAEQLRRDRSPGRRAASSRGRSRGRPSASAPGRGRPPARPRRRGATRSRPNAPSVSRQAWIPATTRCISSGSRWAWTHASTNSRNRSGFSSSSAIQRSAPARGRSADSLSGSNKATCSAIWRGEVLVEQREQQVLLAAEVVVDGALGEPRLLGDLVDRGAVEAAPGIYARGRLEQRGARASAAFGAIELTPRHM